MVIQEIEGYCGITTFPFIPGHEIVGNVSAVGVEVDGMSEGDRVVAGGGPASRPPRGAGALHPLRIRFP